MAKPSLTIEQRAGLKARADMRKALRLEIRALRDQRAALREQLVSKIRELKAIPSMAQESKRYGLATNYLYRVIKTDYKSMNPLDAKAAELRA